MNAPLREIAAFPLKWNSRQKGKILVYTDGKHFFLVKDLRMSNMKVTRD